MKVIDLLNKIANGEKVPKKIHILNCDYIWLPGIKTYHRLNPVYGDLEFGDFYTHDLLNLEVEIIEDTSKEETKIPEKLYAISKTGDLTIEYPHNKELMNKINEVIDYLKNKGDE